MAFENERTKQPRIIGRIPTYIEEWTGSHTSTYKVKNRVTLLGSEFELKPHGNPAHPPIVGYTDARRQDYIDGRIQLVEFNTTDWYIISNGTDAFIGAKKIDGLVVFTTTASMSLASIDFNKNVIFANTDTNVKFSYSISSSVGVRKAVVQKDNVDFYTIEGDYPSHTDTKTINAPVGTLKFHVKAYVNSSDETKYKQSADVNLYVVERIYSGSGTAATVENINVQRTDPNTTPAGTYSVNVRNNRDYVYFDIPNTMNINKATVSGFDMPLQVVTSPRSGYKCYQSRNTYDAGTLTVVLS
jgi:hypothetical protein